jgi:hypothetical protein
MSQTNPDPLDQRLDSLETILQGVDPANPAGLPLREMLMTLFSLMKAMPRGVPSPEARLVEYRKTAMTLLAGKSTSPDYAEQVEAIAHRILAAERAPGTVAARPQAVTAQAPQAPAPAPPWALQAPQPPAAWGANVQQPLPAPPPPTPQARCCAGNGFGGHAIGCPAGAAPPAAPPPSPPPPVAQTTT